MTSLESYKNGDCFTKEAFEQLALGRLDPESRAALLKHVATCTKCKAEMDRVATETQAITQALKATEPHTDDECLDNEYLARFLDGGLSEAERETVEQHLSTCATCQKNVVAIHRETRAILDLLEQVDERNQSATLTQPEAEMIRWPAPPDTQDEIDPTQRSEDSPGNAVQQWKSIAAACAAGATLTTALFIPRLALPLVVFALTCITFLYTELTRNTETNFASSLRKIAGRTPFLIGALLAWGLTLLFPLVSPILLPAAFTSYLIWLSPTRRPARPPAASSSIDDSEDETKLNATQNDSR